MAETDAGTTSEPPRRPSRPELRRLPPRILLADDDDELRGMLAESLREYGYDVTEARDGSELWSFASWSLAPDAATCAVDMVVTDVRMPGASGIEVLDELRRLDPRVRSIVITGVGDERTAAAAREAGAALVFDKPFQLDDFLIVVLSLLPPPDDALRAA